MQMETARTNTTLISVAVRLEDEKKALFTLVHCPVPNCDIPLINAATSSNVQGLVFFLRSLLFIDFLMLKPEDTGSYSSSESSSCIQRVLLLEPKVASPKLEL